MRGGPTHVDTFDYKPALTRDDGKSVTLQGLERGAGRRLLKSPWKFNFNGQSGLPISELFPHLSRHADNICLLNSLNTSVPNHPQSFLMLHTGEFRFTRPSMGSWILYGLGTENQNLPGFISVSPPADLGGAQNFGNAFLPASFQATRIGGQGDARSSSQRVGNLTSPLSDNLVPPPARPSAKHEPGIVATAANRSEHRRGHQLLRTRFPHAKLAPRVDGPVARIASAAPRIFMASELAQPTISAGSA